MSFGATKTASRPDARLLGQTPPGLGPGKYETNKSGFGHRRPGDSTAGSSVFAASKKKVAKEGSRLLTPGPMAYSPETYGAIGSRPISAPRIAMGIAVRKPVENARREVRSRGTPPSIPPRGASSFAYEEDEFGRLKPIDNGPVIEPSYRVGPGLYTPLPNHLMISNHINFGNVDFSRSTGRERRSAQEGGPPQLMPSAPGWHAGESANPLPMQGLPSMAFAVPTGGDYGLLPSNRSSPAPKGISPHSKRGSSAGGSSGMDLVRGSPSTMRGAGPDGKLGLPLSTSHPNIVTEHSPGGTPSGGAGGGIEMYEDGFRVCNPAVSFGVTQRSAGHSLPSEDAPHMNRHSRGRTRVRGALVSSTGVPNGNGGLLGRQMASKRNHRPGVPGPGTHEVAPGIGATKPVPQGGLPRPRPFYAAHLRALSNLGREEQQVKQQREAAIGDDGAAFSEDGMSGALGGAESSASGGTGSALQATGSRTGSARASRPGSGIPADSAPTAVVISYSQPS